MRWPKITAWAQPGGLPECPYFRRWIADFETFTLRLHRWYHDDDSRHPHDHPYWFYTFVLWGGYDDVSYRVDREGDCMVKDVQHMSRGSWAYRPAEHLHQVLNVQPGTVTLLITGKPGRRWGFRVGRKFLGRNTYFAIHGHHPCDPAGQPVRMKPDGSRI